MIVRVGFCCCFTFVVGAVGGGVAGCADPPSDPALTPPTCEDAIAAAEEATATLDDEFDHACAVDSDCVFDPGNVCGVDIAEFVYAAAEADEFPRRVALAWSDVCDLDCGLRAGAGTAAVCDAGRCRIADAAAVCAVVLDDVIAQVDAGLDASCAVDADCGRTSVLARCNEGHRFQLTRPSRGDGGGDDVDVDVICPPLAAGMSLRCRDGEGDVGCVDGVCVYVDAARD